MIFSVQRFVEDYLVKRGVDCSDDYAAKAATTYVTARRPSVTSDELAAKLSGIRTVIYRNAGVKRSEVEHTLASALLRHFKKKSVEAPPGFASTVASQRRRLPKRLSARLVLERFAAAVRARAVEAFWDSRGALKLKPKPESIAGGLLGVFACEALRGRGVALKEAQSGTGYIDLVMIMRGGVPHLVELKIHRTGHLAGPAQLAAYMRQEGRTEGWLVIFDARNPARRSTLTTRIANHAGTIHVIEVDINPLKPSSR